MGSSAGTLLTPQEESEYGAYTLYQLRRYGYVTEDPLIDSWLDTMGHRLAAVSDRPQQQFTFFMMGDRSINAFATLGGYVGVNAGLVLTAQNEDEVAGVIAHEISHVTQRHVLRAVERAKRDQLPLMLAMVGAIIAAQSSNSRNSGDAIQAAVMGSQALAMQRQLDYSRLNEAEADRVGLQTLYRSGYDVNGMADFFERMDRTMRGNSGGIKAPAYLQSHPVTATRISEARQGAARLQRESPRLAATSRPSSNPLLPFGLGDIGSATTGNLQPRMFEWAKERLRVLSAASPGTAVQEYRLIFEHAGGRVSDAQRYGLALAQMRAGSSASAEASLQSLLKAHPENLWIDLALAECAHAGKNDPVAKQRFEDLLRRFPQDRSISLSYALMLNDIGGAEAGRRAQSVLKPLLSSSSEDPLFQKNFGRASELAGDTARATEAYADAAFLNGRAEDALTQLNGLLKRDDIDYIQRARVEARIAAITPIVLDMRRQGVKPQDQTPDPG
ncbi:MAG TPA: M48 family metalloprotease [Arenimonas sp.]|nr:M48 family metalloprotease [Arenimonas sp.]HMB57746.1 M48 family metalloprotease [Arenimonas sp.]